MIASPAGRTAHAVRPVHLPRRVPITQLIGYAAGALTVASYVPQTVRVWRTHQVRDLSYGMFALLILACALWVLFGVLLASWPIIIPNTLALLLNVAIFTAKVRFRRDPAVPR